MDKSGHREIQLSEGHLQTGVCRWVGKSGHGKNPTEQGALTSWRAQTDGQVRTQKESNQERGTHILESADGQTSQDMERIQPSEGHSHTGECRWTSQDTVRTECGVLTDWRVQIDRQVRTEKASDRVGATHKLESAERQKNQDMERI